MFYDWGRRVFQDLTLNIRRRGNVAFKLCLGRRHEEAEK